MRSPSYFTTIETVRDGREVEATIEYRVSKYRPQSLNEPAEYPTPEICEILIDGVPADPLAFEEISDQVSDDWLVSEAAEQAAAAADDAADYQLERLREAF